MEIKREIYSGQELDSKLQKGINKLADAVKVTMGPKGKLVLIHRPGKHPIVTKDGVTVAQAINLTDEVENLGAQVIKESAARTAEEAGDGTTTATVLAREVLRESQRYIASGASPVELKRGMDAAVEAIVSTLREMAVEISDVLDTNIDLGVGIEKS